MVVELLAIHGNNLALLELNLQQRLLLRVRYMLQISLLGQSLCGVEQLAATDTGTPDADVIRILQLGEVSKVAVGVQVVHLFLTSQIAVARQGDNLHTGSHHQEGHIETDLVVTSTR